MDLNNLIPKNYYEVKTKCKNCSQKQMTKIKKGNKPEDVLYKGKCENCGVNELEMIK